MAGADGWAYYGPNIRYLGERYFRDLKSGKPADDPAETVADFAGASTLVRQELARNLKLPQGKRLVIWTFAERDLRFGMKGWEKIALEE